MNIKNVSPSALSFYLGNKVTTLAPGQSVDTDITVLNRHLQVFKRKKLIEITESVIKTTEVQNVPDRDIPGDTKVTEAPVKRRGRPFGTTKPKPDSNEPKKPRGRPVGSTKKTSFEIAEDNAEKYIKGDSETK
jgi:hypothetical protein